jgi:hypothetical protein
MTTVPTNLHDVADQYRDVRHKAGPFVEKFARVGYAAKGVVYAIVGVLAAMAAFGAGGDTTGSRGVMETIARQPFGQILLGLVALGLTGYSLWQFIRAIEDPDNEGQGGKAIAKRIGFFISGVIHFGLVWYAIGVITGAAIGGGGGDDAGAKSWSATAMSFPMGQWLVGAVGIGFFCYGVRQLVRAFQADLDKRLHLGEIPPRTRRIVVNISRFGMAARGVVFGIIGIFLAVAAWRENPNEARGLGGALHALEEQPYGPWLLGVVAIGLSAYGIYELAKARYRQINAT